MVVTFSVLAIVVSVGTSSLGALSTRFSLDNGTRTVAMALNQARVYAITRGHVVNVNFTTHGFSSTDTQAAAGSQGLIAGEVASPVTLSASGPVSFTPLGSVGSPFAVTVYRGTDTRTISIGLAGEVDIQ